MSSFLGFIRISNVVIILAEMGF